jgi:ATP synthase protein I
VLGAALALLVVTLFFALDYVVLGRAARNHPQTLMGVALGSYLVKFLALAILSAEFKDTTLFNGKAFGFTAIVCVLCWSATQAYTWMKAKTFYVEPGKS